ncbi:MAG: autophagy-related protein 27 [archaeon]|nr:autophagy-related protein 27 [archaeon]
MMYYFNFGNHIDRECKGSKVAVAEVLEVLKQTTDTCEILGKLEQNEVGLLDQKNPNKGIYVLYKGGDICESGQLNLNGKPRQTKFSIHCARKEDYNFKLDLPGETQGTTKCLLEFKINSPAGCPGGAYSGGLASKILIWLLIISLIYIIAGMVYNYKKFNLKGVDGIPNKDFWKTFFINAKDGANITFRKTTSSFTGIVNKYYRKQAQNSGYTDI